MKLLLLALCGCIFAGAVVFASPLTKTAPRGLLGAKECTWGPSYWCYNITNAKSCRAVTHCIQTVWETHNTPEDTDSVCKICLDMVTQARDQLRSNATQEDIKAVFEGSCELIPIKPIAKMCDRTVDNFIPELVEALSSEMDPTTVCSVAGLCNNAAIDKMLENAAAADVAAVPVDATVPSKTIADDDEFTCTKCQSISTIIAEKFRRADRDDVLETMLRTCGQMSSFSDACANIVLTYFNDMYDHMRTNLNADNICHMSGSCVERYHQHTANPSDSISVEQLQLEIRPMSSVGVQTKDDIPCELCQQLVHHLKDLLIANTTETEFKSVMEGLCNQTRSFKAECLSIVDQYYVTIYDTLVKNLNENEACCAIQICPRDAGYRQSLGDIAPLLPIATAGQVVTITAKPLVQKPNKKLLGEGEPILSAAQISQAQLPIDRLMGAPQDNGLVKKGDFCLICQYFLHYVQDALATAQNEEAIKQYASRSCDEIRYEGIRSQCKSFIETYGDSIIWLAIQGLAPREICPHFYICPPNQVPTDQFEVFAPAENHEMDVKIQTKNSGTEKCPLCLFAVQAAVDNIQSDKSKSNIRHTLNSLCVHLPQKLQLECTDFVETYTNELLDMLASDFTPQDICVALKLCDNAKPRTLPTSNGDGDIMTNEIPDDTINGQFISSIDVEYDANPNCLLCEQVVKEVEKRIVNKKSREEIKLALEHACEKMHKIKQKCNAIIDKYGDKIVDLIMKELTPKEICRELGQCIIRMQAETNDDLKITVVAIPASRIGGRFEPITNANDDIFSVANDDDDVQSSDPNTAYIHATDSTICVICQTVMTQLEKDLADKTTQTEIKNAIKNVCHSLPKSFSVQCTKFIDSYATLIISLIDTTPPKEICGQMKLCSAPTMAESKLEVLECAVCHSTTQSLMRVLEDPKVERSIDHVLEKTCRMLPGRYYDKCVSLIEIYGPSMMNIISKSGEIQTVCTQIGMCFPDEYASFAQVQMIN